MIIHNFEQGTDEWQSIRLGKFTGSDFHTLLGKSKAAQDIIYKKTSERLTGSKSDSDSFSNIHTKRGHDLENDARLSYEFTTDNQVMEVGFIELNEFVGCSPDGLVGNDGMVEIKCKDNHNHLKSVIKNHIEPTHLTQMQFNMFVSDRKWCDYIMYNPNFSDPLHVIRVERDEEYINKIKNRLDELNTEVNKIINQFKGK